MSRHPSAPARQGRADRTRAAILAAAERVFAESGLAGARTDAIAAAAGVNKALLYYYFQSKERLYEAVMEHHLQEFNRVALEVLAAPGSPPTILLQYVNLHFDFVSARHRQARLFQQMMIGGGQPMQRLVRKYFTPRSRALRNLLERGIRSGDFRRVDPFQTAVSIVGLIVFYFSAAQVLQWLGHADAYSKTNLQHRKQEVLEFIRHGLFVNPDS
ncbi:MAG TPA: TetR/AcrR family transcriptional regulator [Verrucomicrobiae bacterium]|nr:TetR/AcrR family transcriptional regulator [Verrucomicrobiae bacterium]